jgi:ABC-type uncharacterized transport system permease subunit
MTNVSVELTPRTQTPRWFAVAVQGLTVVAALAVAALALVAVDANPVTVYSEMFLGAFSDPLQASRVFNRSAPLILAGLAVYIPLRSGLYNIGAEGQLIIGGLVTVWVGTRLPEVMGVGAQGATVFLAALAVAILAGAVWVYVPVYLYNKYEVNEILTTLMLVFTAERVSAYLISGPLQAGGGGFPRTDSIAFDLPTLFGTRVDVGIIFALLAVGGIWVLINRTRLGYEVVLSGSNEGVARQTGIGTKKISFVVFTLAAALAGLAGFLEVAGNQSSLTIGWQPGYGWTAIPIALLGRRGAVRTMLAGFLFGFIFVGASTVETTLGVPAAISQIIEALIILFLISGEVLKTHQLDLVLGRWSLRESVGKLARVGRPGGN